MRKEVELEIKVGLFITVGVGLIMLAILVLGGADSLLTRQNRYYVHFQNVEGLVTGAKVVLGGLQVGTVKGVDFDFERKDIQVELMVGRKYQDWIKKDCSAEIATQGVLGDKFISLSSGAVDSPSFPAGSEIPARPSKDITQFISKSDQLLANLNKIAGSLDKVLKSFADNNRSETFFQGMSVTAKNLSQASEKLNQELEHIKLRSVTQNLNGILEKINNGTGTLGALINDPALYYDARALLGGANRNRIIRNLVRKTVKEGDQEQAKEPAPDHK